jgi:hypothetical protein
MRLAQDAAVRGSDGKNRKLHIVGTDTFCDKFSIPETKKIEPA